MVRTIEAAGPARGPADEALPRLVAASWEMLAQHEEIARASAAELGADAMREAHESARAVLRKVIKSGRKDGAFRTDLRVEWLLTSSLALIHAAAESVRAREIRPPALDTLLASN